MQTENNKQDWMNEALQGEEFDEFTSSVAQICSENRCEWNSTQSMCESIVWDQFGLVT